MSPMTHPYGEPNMEEAPMSRTHQYRKVMKPLLERKRRARINKSLDNLKDLMVFAMQSEGESITKLEKADVLEITVRHLQKLKRQQQLQIQPGLDTDRYRAGYMSCIGEVSRFLTIVPGVNPGFGHSLMNHLSQNVSSEDSAAAVKPQIRPRMSVSPAGSDGGYNSGRDSNSPTLSVGSPSPRPAPTNSATPVWRPF